MRTSWLILMMLVSTSTLADDWPHWRGPNFNGSSDETGLATHWSRTEGLAWTAILPGPSAATPVVHGRYLFVSSTDPDNGQLLALCFDAVTGHLKWEKEVSVGEVRRDNGSNFASCSPVTDGKMVVFFYGTGQLVAYGMEGNALWKRDIQEDYGEFAFLWTYASSPLIHDGRLYLQVLQRDVPVEGRGFEDQPNESYLLALVPETGESLWKVFRASEAVAESRESFSSPVVATVNGITQILVAGGDDVTGHDPATGEELWRWGTWNPSRIEHWRFVPSPVASTDVVLVCAPKKSPVYAVKGGGEGELDDDALAWTSKDRSVLTSDVPTPAFYGGDFFILSDLRKTLARVEPTTGEIKWSAPTPGSAKYEASPTVVDNKVYLINFVGDVVIYDATSGQELNTISMAEPADDPIRSTVVAANGRLYIRTNDHLYCVASNAP